ncbi:MAG: hypothetical protein GY853_14355 [PVC group bacterium]|nr:hypothetical protein [PVC group bacterium]
MKIFNKYVRSARNIKRVIKESLENIELHDENTIHRLMGVYNARLFGLCFYKNDNKMLKEFDTLIKKPKTGEEME